MTKKRHHYIPQVYLKPFCNEEGKLRVYRKDDPDQVIHLSPINIGFHKYYYSQPLPDGNKDNDTLEDLFERLETRWTPLVERFHHRENVNDCLEDIFQFIALQRARVPASRDACEALLADMVKIEAKRLVSEGKLPPPPKGHEHILDHAEVAIDPHQSIHAMVPMLQGAGKLFDLIGIVVLHNTTDTPFLTSDNPVIWFDPSIPDANMRPYAIREGGPIVLLFPVAPDLLIYGDSTMHEQFAVHGLRYGELSEPGAVKTMNQQICRFAYETVFAQRSGQEDLIRTFTGLSPVVRTDTIPIGDGELILPQLVWGQRKRKPKWDKR